MPQLIVMQQALLRYYGNATWCIDHVTKENLICRNINVGLVYMGQYSLFLYSRFWNCWTNLVEKKIAVRRYMERGEI
jgi:hypothetical protein